jgi:hypothetical protein
MCTVNKNKKVNRSVHVIIPTPFMQCVARDKLFCFSGKLTRQRWRVRSSTLILALELLTKSLAQYRAHTILTTMANRRLVRLKHELAPAPSMLGTLTFGDITFDVPQSDNPSRLPRVEPLDMSDIRVRKDLHWMLQKYLLGQDVFLLGQPGLYARRLAMTFCRCV